MTKDSKGNNQFGLGIDAASSAPTASQMSDESAVMQSKIAVTAMQVAYDQRPAGQEWLKIRLKAYLTSKEKDHETLFIGFTPWAWFGGL